MNTVAKIIKKVSSTEKVTESSLPHYKPIPKAIVSKLQRESSLPRIEVERPSPLCRSASAPIASSTLNIQSLVLHNDNFDANKDDRSQKLLTNTKKVRGLRSFLWVKPQSSTGSATFVSQLVPCLIANLGCLSIGLSLGLSSVLLPWLAQKENIRENDTGDFQILNNHTTSRSLHLNNPLSSWIASIFWIGSFIGVFLSHWINQKLGARLSLLLLCGPDLLGWFLVAVNQNYHTLIIARLLTGLSAGGYISKVQSYTKEICSPQYLNLLSLLHLPSTGVGILLVYSLGLLLPPNQVAIFAVLVPVMLAINLSWTWDTPYWLVSTGRQQEALLAVAKLRGGDTSGALQEVLRIQHERKQLPDTLDIWEAILTIYRKYGDIFATINVLFFFMAFSGKFSVDFFAIELIKKSGVPSYEHLYAIIAAFIYVVGAILFIIMDSKISRKHLYVASSIFSGIFLTQFGISGFQNSMDYSSSTLVPVFSLSVFLLAQPLGLSSLPFSLLAESYPVEVRSIAKSLTLALTSLQLFLSTKLYYILQDYIGFYAVFWIQAGVCFMAGLLSIRILPNPRKDKMESLEDYDKFAGLRRQRNQPWVIPIPSNNMKHI